jgi:hypothetical protein
MLNFTGSVNSKLPNPMKITLDNFEKHIPPARLRKGHSYFESGAVLRLEPAPMETGRY